MKWNVTFRRLYVVPISSVSNYIDKAFLPSQRPRLQSYSQIDCREWQWLLTQSNGKCLTIFPASASWIPASCFRKEISLITTTCNYKKNEESSEKLNGKPIGKESFIPVRVGGIHRRRAYHKSQTQITAMIVFLEGMPWWAVTSFLCARLAGMSRKVK